MLYDAVHLLWHTDVHGEEKLIGVYRTVIDAQAAVERIKKMPGFSDEGGGFEVAEYRLNQDHWGEGCINSIE